MRDRLPEEGPPRPYTMWWVDVPSLQVSRSDQRYKPLGNDLVGFEAGDSRAEIRFDHAKFVLDYPGIAARV